MNSYGYKTMSRPDKYQNLGGMPDKMRVPTSLQGELEKLFSELDRVGAELDPEGVLSELTQSLREYQLGEGE